MSVRSKMQPAADSNTVPPRLAGSLRPSPSSSSISHGLSPKPPRSPTVTRGSDDGGGGGGGVTANSESSLMTFMSIVPQESSSSAIHSGGGGSQQQQQQHHRHVCNNNNSGRGGGGGGSSSASSSLFPSEEDEREEYDDNDDEGFFSSSVVRMSSSDGNRSPQQLQPQISMQLLSTPNQKIRSATPSQPLAMVSLCSTIVPSLWCSSAAGGGGRRFDCGTPTKSPRPLSLPVNGEFISPIGGGAFVTESSNIYMRNNRPRTPPGASNNHHASGSGSGGAVPADSSSSSQQQPPHATRVQQARLRALNVRHSEQEHKQRQWNATMQRQNEAQKRREILEDMPLQQRVASWLVLEQLTRSIAFMDTLRKRERTRKRGVMVYPIVALRLRRLLRRIRLNQLAAAQVARPSISTLRNDKILNLFSDAHLAYAIEKMHLKYFFPNELIISMGIEEDEGYFLVQGSADVLMGRTSVFTLRAGMCFGTVGMVSGEPRTATVMAREACVVWVISRRDFNSFDGGDGVGKEELSTALQTVEDLRRSNMLNVYKRQLDASSLAMYPVFHGMSSEFLNEVAKSQCLPVIAKGDSHVMLHLPNQPLSQRSPFLLLRGTVVVYASLNSWRGRSLQNVPFYMQLRMLYDVPRRQKSICSTAGRQRYTSASGTHGSLQYTDKNDDIESVLRAGMEKGKILPQNSADDDRVELLRVRAPALFNLAPTIQGYHTTLPFLVCAKSDCDVLSLSRDVLRSQDVLELAALRQNSLNMRCDFFKAMSRADLVRVLFREHMIAANTSSVTAPATSEFGAVTSALLRGDALENAATIINEERWVYNAQDVIRFDLESDFQVHIILSGEVEDPTRDQRSSSSPVVSSTIFPSFPYVWPRISEAWFAGSNHTLRAWTQVEAIRIPRRDIVGWVAQELMRDAMQGPLSSLPTSSAKFDLIRQLVKTLGTAVLQRTHRMPQFHHHQLLSTIGGDADVDMSASVATRRMGASVRQSTVVILPTTSSEDSTDVGGGGGGSGGVNNISRPRGSDVNILGNSMLRQQGPGAVMNTSATVLATLETISVETIRMVMRLLQRQGMSTVGGSTGASSSVPVSNTNSNASSSSTSAHAGRASSPASGSHSNNSNAMSVSVSQSMTNATSGSPSPLHKRIILQVTNANNSNSNNSSNGSSSINNNSASWATFSSMSNIDFPSPPSQTLLQHHARLMQSSSSSVFEAVAGGSGSMLSRNQPPSLPQPNGSTASLRTTRSRPASAASTTTTSNSSSSLNRTAGTVSARLQPTNTMRVEIPNSNHSCTTTDGGAGGEAAVSPSRIHALLKKLNGESEHIHRGV